MFIERRLHDALLAGERFDVDLVEVLFGVDDVESPVFHQTVCEREPVEPVVDEGDEFLELRVRQRGQVLSVPRVLSQLGGHPAHPRPLREVTQRHRAAVKAAAAAVRDDDGRRGEADATATQLRRRVTRARRRRDAGCHDDAGCRAKRDSSQTAQSHYINENELWTYKSTWKRATLIISTINCIVVYTSRIVE